MKLQEFKDLCFEQWELRHGDIMKLVLTKESRKELELDMLLEPNQPLILNITTDDVEHMRAGDYMYPSIVNPITRTEVKLETTSYRDFAEVVFPLDSSHIPPAFE